MQIADMGFNITIHMVSSVDGIIAKSDNSISWFETSDNYEKGVDEPDVTAFLKTIDCYVMGAKTYEHALELSKSYGWAYGDIPTIVLSHKSLPVERKNVEIYSGGLIEFVENRLKPKYNNVWVVGGAKLASDFIRWKLVDEIRMTMVPVLLGDGLHFFEGLLPEQSLHLKESVAYKNGMVELCYEIKK